MDGLTLTLTGILFFAIVMNIIGYVDWRKRSRAAHPSR